MILPQIVPPARLRFELVRWTTPGIKDKRIKNHNNTVIDMRSANNFSCLMLRVHWYCISVLGFILRFYDPSAKEDPDFSKEPELIFLQHRLVHFVRRCGTGAQKHASRRSTQLVNLMGLVVIGAGERGPIAQPYNSDDRSRSCLAGMELSFVATGEKEGRIRSRFVVDALWIRG